MSELSTLRVWEDPAIREALSWYLDVAENRRPAKFRIAATLATELDPAASGEDALWTELDRLTPILLARWRAIRTGAPLPEAAEGPSLLEPGGPRLEGADFFRPPPPVLFRPCTHNRDW